MSDDIVVVDNGSTYETQESAIVAKNEADRAEQWAKYSEEKANLADERAVDAAESSDAAAQAATAAIEAKQYAETAITDENLIVVATDLKSTPSNIKKTAGSIDNVNTVSNDIENINAVAANKVNIDKVATDKDNIDTVATNIVNVNTVAKNIDNVNLLAPHTEAMEALSPDIMDVVTVAGIAEQTKNVSDNMFAVVDVSNNKTNINTVAANRTAINNVSKNMSDVKNAVQSANDAKLWAVGTITEKPEGSSKYWAEQAQQAAQVYDATETVKGIVRLATSDEVTTGTNNSVAITPLKLKSSLDTKQDKSTAISYDNISNCITEIPQDIKLELNNGTLTLKAGSKVYVPNGFESDGTTKKFDMVVIESDKVWSSRNLDYPQQFVFLTSSQAFEAVGESGGTIYSGATAPSGKQFMLWYDTTNNFIKWTNDSGATWVSGNSLPLSICSSTKTNNWTSIDQVFNGFGYIGSTIFALPGVKGLIPNGRNDDGSLKSIEVVQNSVKIMTMASYMAGRKYCPLELFSNNELGGMEIDFNSWGTVATLKDLPRDKVYAAYYCLEDNFLHYFNNTGVESINKSLFAATFAVGDDNKITSFTPKTVFQALDYNDKSTVSGWGMPSSRYIDLTLGASGSTYTAPANGWFFVSKKSTAATQEFVFENKSAANFAVSQDSVTANRTIRLTISAKKGDNIYTYYTLGGSTDYFRFIFAEGEN